MKTEILNSNFDLENIIYPKNIYALRICDEKGNVYNISVSHNGFCPNISTEREQSNFNDYLSNLEWVSRMENGVHRYKNKNTTSKYCGVSWSKSNNKWYSSIRFNGKKIAIGMFVDEIEAYNARVEFEKENGITNKYL